MRQARSTKAESVCIASAAWNNATQASSGRVAATMAALLVYSPTTGSRAKYSKPPMAMARPSVKRQPVPAQASRVAQLARADALRHQGAGGIGQTQRHHEQHRHQVDGDLVTGHRLCRPGVR